MVVRPCIAALAAVALAGCGAAADSDEEFAAGPQRDVAAVVEELQDKALRREATDICTDLLTVELARRIAQAQRTQTCEGGLDPILDDVDAVELTVDGVKVAGANATAEVLSEGAGDSERRDRFALRRVGANWRIDGFGR